MQHFKSPPRTQTFLSIFGPIYEHSHPKKLLMQADDYRDQLANRFGIGDALIA